MKTLLSFVLLTCMGSASVAAMGREARARSYSDPSPCSWDGEGFDVDGEAFTPRATTSQSSTPIRPQDSTDAAWFEETAKLLGVIGATALLAFLSVQQAMNSQQ